MVKIRITQNTFGWSVAWTLDAEQSWHVAHVDTYGDAINLAANIGAMRVNHVAG